MSPQDSKPAALVIGAGLAGMTAAHHLAEVGAHVYLIDRAPHLGGAFLSLDHTFTTDSCGLCLALPRQPSYCPTIASELNPRITTLPGTTLTALQGEAGSFIARLVHAPRTVDLERCDHCSACVEVCPVSRDTGTDIRPAWTLSGEQKAIYPPPPRAVPFVYAIDPDACIRCGACADACPRGAIDLEAAASESQVEIDTVLLAPGFVPFDAARALEYGWGRYANVVSSLEFERMLNRSGPTGGRPLRPSDRQPPRRIAFIHCVGSRNEKLGRPYCATSCCMIAAKQVSLTGDVAPETEMTVFTMDVRTAGKGYERYFQRVEASPRVHYCRGLPAAVRETPGEQNLLLLTPDGEQSFDLVILVVGMGPSDGMRALAACTGIELDQHGFVVSGADGPGSTSRQGIFAAGSALAPADVPETVTQAAAAAALAARDLTPPLDPSSRRSEQKQGLLDQPPRIGIFVCTCRGLLEERLDLPALTTWGQGLAGVVHVAQVEAACEPSGQGSIEKAAAQHDLNRIVFAGYSPRLYDDRFADLADRLGLPSRLLARIDIRTSTTHGLDTARRELAMVVAGLRETPYTQLVVHQQQNPSPRVLVLGGGLSGMTAALTLADLGVDCDLVEREAKLGGNLRHSVRTLEGLDAQAMLSATVARLQQAKAVRTWTETQLAGWSGMRGEFTAQLQVGGETHHERYGALIVATGSRQIIPQEYLYGQDPAVITQRELEARLADPGSVTPRSVVMIQCVGSRDETRPYCSRVCCAHAIKNALALKKRDPAIQVSVLFRDIRTMGQHELYYQEDRRLGVLFIQYDVHKKPAVERLPVSDDKPAQPETCNLQPSTRLCVTVWDAVLETEIALTPDLVVLSTGIEPDPGHQTLAQTLGMSLDEDGFFAEAHPKLRPTDLARPGIFVCGLAYGPRFIDESISQARAAALRAALAVRQPPEPRHDIVTVVPKLCSFCGLCVAHCPYGARVLDEEQRFARVIDHLCQGCGLCVAACPNGATRQPALEPAQLLAMVDAVLID